MANYKNPNGYGSVVKLSGNRRKPFAVRKTVGYDDRAYPIYEIIGYYPTRKDAMIALADYNKEPYDFNTAKITFSELYERWAKTTYHTLKESSVSAHKAAYKYCEPLYNIKYREIRKHQMQQCIDSCGKSYATQTNIRNLLTLLDKFAFDLDIVSKCYSTNLRVSEKTVTKDRNVFTDLEVQKLSKRDDCDEILFMLYTGCRISEMLTVECANVDLEKRILRCGVKTEAGKNRVIPIHSKLMSIIKKHMSDEKYLFHIDYDIFRSKEIEQSRENAYRKTYRAIMRDTGMNHIPHECRHTFRSKLDSAEANKVCIDLIMGHKTGDVGERVYTHKTIEELKTAIEKLSYGV